MANFWRKYVQEVCTYGEVKLPESEFMAIPMRPSTSELAEDLLIDPEALRLETHEPGIYDESGDYIPQYSDDPQDLEFFQPNSLDAPEGETAPESVPADKPFESDTQ